MVDTVYSQKDIKLQDGAEVGLRPLPIAGLKKFMKSWKKIEELSEDIEIFDVYVECAGIGIKDSFKDKFDGNIVNADGISQEYREYLEEVLDLDTIFEILDVCAGIKLNDPKLMEAAEKIIQGEAGTT